MADQSSAHRWTRHLRWLSVGGNAGLTDVSGHRLLELHKHTKQMMGIWAAGCEISREILHELQLVSNKRMALLTVQIEVGPVGAATVPQ